MLVEMFFWAVVVPAAVAFVVSVAAATRWPSPESTHRHRRGAVAPYALLLGFGGAWASTLEVPEWWPTNANDWPFWAAVFVVVGGTLSRTRATLPPPLRWSGRIVLTVGTAWLLTRNLAANAWTPVETVLNVALVAGVIGGLWATLSLAARRADSMSVAGAFVALSAGVAGVAVLASSARLGQMSGMMAAAASGLAASMWLTKPSHVPLGNTVPLVAVVVGSIASLAFLLAELPLTGLLLVPLAPLPLLMKGPGRSPIVAAMVGALLTLPVLGGAAALAAWSASLTADERPTTVDSYDEDYGY